MERGTPEQRVNRKRKNKTFKIVVLWMMILSAIWLPCGCIRKKPEITGEKSTAFQLMSEREIPEELKEWMEQEKAHPFMLTYAVEQDIYAARSYGPQNKTGYQIKVDAVLEGEKRCGSRQVFWDRKRRENKGCRNLSVCGGEIKKDRKRNFI